MSLEQLADKIYMTFAATPEGSTLGLNAKDRVALDSQGYTTRSVERRQVEDVSAEPGWW